MRIALATIYTPTGHDGGFCDPCHYRDMNQLLLEGKVTRIVSFILTPVMLVGRILGLSDLTGTVVGGCIIGALSIIPLWFISEHLKINPMVTSFLYVFAPLDIAEVLTWGGYSLLFGMLTVNVYVWLIFRKNWLGLLVLIPVILTHNTSSMYIGLFVFSIFLLNLLKDKKVDKLILTSLILVFGILAIKYAYTLYGWNPTKGGLDNQLGLPDQGRVRITDWQLYLSIVGVFSLALAVIGLKPFLNSSTDTLILTWLFLPHILTFMPLFSNPTYSLRLLAFGTGGMSILGCYALKDWEKKKGVWKTVLIAFLFLNITRTIIHSILAFSQYGV